MSFISSALSFTERSEVCFTDWPKDIPPQFKPLSYVGYDLTVEVKDDLRKWVDFAGPNFGERTKDLSIEELGLVERIEDAVYRIFPDMSNHKIINLEHQIKPFRTIRELNPKKIYEIGPGHGYLGALLGLVGYDYGSVDIIKGFHYWQKLLWSELGLSNKQQPWWEHNPYPVDLVYSNANLAEMTPEALEYYLPIIHKQLEDSNGLLMFFCPGAEYGQRQSHVYQRILDHGFYKAEEYPFYAYRIKNAI